MADFLVTFGIQLYKRLDYDVYYGLLLNLGRARMQMAYSVMRGVKAAVGGRAPQEMFDAVAASEDEAQEMKLEADAAFSREKAKQAAKRFL